MSHVFVISGPSGVGKTSLLQAALTELAQVAVSVSYTTRQPRRGEVHGNDYYFIDEAEFRQRREAGEFLEWAQVFGYYYATSKIVLKQLMNTNESVILEIDCQGARQVKRQIDCVSVMIVPPSEETLRIRLEHRGQDSPEIIHRRLEQAREELLQAKAFDLVVVNQDFDKAVAELRQILSGQVRSDTGLIK